MRTVCLPGQIPPRTLTVFCMVGGQPGLTNPPAVLTVQPPGPGHALIQCLVLVAVQSALQEDLSDQAVH